MGQIALKEYLGQIEWLIEENRLAQAAAHCRQILIQYPRHVDTYRLLGRALLEQQEFKAAQDIYLRVLSADPEDLIAHAGLTLIYKETGDIVQALWHLQCAYDMDPYNRAIQEELRELQATQNGNRQERLELTRGALGRIYFRGAHYRQSANELEVALAELPDRLDLQVLLAEALYQDDRRVEAIKVCLDVLEHLPYCVKANAILAEVWTAGGLADEAEEYLRRLWTLTLLDSDAIDQSSLFSQVLDNNGVLTLPQQVLVDELDYFPTGESEEIEEVEWIEEVMNVGVDSEEIPDWLQEPSDSLVEESVVAAKLTTDDQEMLDWLEGIAEEEGELFDFSVKETSSDEIEPKSDKDDELSPFEELDEKPFAHKPTIIDKEDEIELDEFNVADDIDALYDQLDEQQRSNPNVLVEPDLAPSFEGEIVVSDVEKESVDIQRSSPEAEILFSDEKMNGEDLEGPLSELLDELVGSIEETDDDLEWLFDPKHFEGEIELEDTDELPGWMTEELGSKDQDIFPDQVQSPGETREGIAKPGELADEANELEEDYDWLPRDISDLSNLTGEQADYPQGRFPNLTSEGYESTDWLAALAAEQLATDEDEKPVDQFYPKEDESLLSEAHYSEKFDPPFPDGTFIEDKDSKDPSAIEHDGSEQDAGVYDTNDLSDSTYARDWALDADDSDDTDELDSKEDVDKNGVDTPASWLEALSHEPQIGEDEPDIVSSNLDEVEDTSRQTGGEPDWLYDAIGFGDSFDIPESEDLPNWLDNLKNNESDFTAGASLLERKFGTNIEVSTEEEQVTVEDNDKVDEQNDLERIKSFDKPIETEYEGAESWLDAMALDQATDEDEIPANDPDAGWDKQDAREVDTLNDSQTRDEVLNNLVEEALMWKLTETGSFRESGSDTKDKDRVAHWLEEVPKNNEMVELEPQSDLTEPDPESSMLEELTSSLEAQVTAPDWLYEEIGFTTALDPDESRKIPDWLDNRSAERTVTDGVQEAAELKSEIEDEKATKIKDDMEYDEATLDEFMKGATSWLDAMATDDDPELAEPDTTPDWLAEEKENHDEDEGRIPDWLGALMRHNDIDVSEPVENEERRADEDLSEPES